MGPSMALGHRLRDGGWPRATAFEEADVVVVGGGIAGLAAAGELVRAGLRRVVLVELEPEVGGNSAWGSSTVASYPWGAHYVPLPGPEAVEVAALFEELGVIVGRDGAGRAIYRDEYLCHDPHERLFLHGRWQDGIIPQVGVGGDGQAEIDRFLGRMEALRESRGNDGRPLFAIPVDRSSRDPQWLALDSVGFGAWLDAEGFRGPALRWYLDYCCRDDFGLPAAQVSAWAGIHYFAARDGEGANATRGSVLTWPEGNGWLAARLRERVGVERIRSGVGVGAVVESAGRVEVHGLDASGVAVGWRARRVVLAVPQFVAARMLGGAGGERGRGAVYPPWLVANLHVERLPRGRGVEPAWDNVLYGGRGLGYVTATHQVLGRADGPSVLTYYLPLDHATPAVARAEAAGLSWERAVEWVLGDLGRAHRDLRDLTLRMDVRIWGHGMIAPVPGFVWGGSRAAWAEPVGRIHFAHSDLSGMSLFEEAYTRGVTEARRVAGRMVEERT